MTKEISRSFNQNNLNEDLSSLAFFDPSGGPSIARYDTVKYPQLLKLQEKMIGFFWVPEEISLDRDRTDFNKMTDGQKQIFTETLLRAVLLDSIQGRSPNLILLPVVSLPEVEVLIETWSFNETVHSSAYSYIIRNIYSSPDEIFNRLPHIEGIVDCAKDIAMYYDKVDYFNTLRALHQQNKDVSLVIDGKDVVYDEYEHKKAFWLMLTAINALESLRFYSAFAVFFNFAENQIMQGNAKELQLIARDESIHVGITTQLLNIISTEDKDFAKIKSECVSEVAKIYNDVVAQEIDWVNFVFRDETLLGLNVPILTDYVKYLSRQKMRQFGVPEEMMNFEKIRSNPLPWMDNWLNTGSMQVAPQESEIINYLTGGVDMVDLDEYEFDFDFDDNII